MIGVVPMLGVAGLLEGVGRQIVRLDAVRIAIGGTVLTAWLVFFYAAWSRAGGD